MAAKDEQTPPKQRTKSRAETTNIGKQDPAPLLYPPVEGKSPLSRQTDDFRFDEGLADGPRTKTSVVPHSPVFPIRRSTQAVTTPVPPRRQKLTTQNLQARPTRNFAHEPKPSKLYKLKNMHWLFLVGLGMMAALILWIIGSAALAWGIQRYYDFHYGNPRTSQVDQVVGQGGDSPAHPSHFIAINENHQAVVIELKAGDPAQAITYTTAIYNDNGQAPVTLEFRDVTGDGKPDMIIHIHLLAQDDQIAVFINNGTQFVPANNNDRIKL
jgi:hypothetical protein